LDQPLYADPQFDKVYKTLTLWHKTTRDLMYKNDCLGRVLGFKQLHSCNCWHWFDVYLDVARKHMHKFEPDNKHQDVVHNDGPLFPHEHTENANCPSWQLSEHRERVIRKYVQANKLDFKALYAELKRVLRDSIFHALHTLQIDKCELSGSRSASIIDHREPELLPVEMSENEQDGDDYDDDDDDNSDLGEDNETFFNDSEHFYYSFLPFNSKHRSFLTKFVLKIIFN
jgi:hypothetical protein